MKTIIKLSFLLIAVLLPATAIAYDFKVDGIYYKKNGTNATVTYKKREMINYSYIYENDYAGNVTIPSAVTYNGTTYTVTMIDYSAFRNSNELISVTIPNTVISIHSFAFSGCGELNSITIPNSVTYLGIKSFENCQKLTSITIPSSVTEIDYQAFKGCTALKTVNYNAVFCADFMYDDNGYYDIEWSDTYFRIAPFYDLGISTINIGNDVQKIPAYFAYGMTSLTSINIGNSVTSIGNYAFQGCCGLTSLTIPNSVTNIGSGTFYDCSGLTYLVVSTGNSKYDSRNNCNAIIETSSNSLIVGCKNTTIPNSINSIGDCAFYGCTGLTSITIPNSITSIGNSAFQGCLALTNLNYNAVSCADFSSTAAKRPFYNLNISTINIGDSVQRIPAYFAYGLTEVTHITIPQSVTGMGTNAFYGCSGITDLVWNAKNCSYNGDMTTSNIVHVTIGDEVETIPNYFVNGSKITELSIPNSVNSIGNYAFQGCTSLATLIFNADSCADFGSGSSCPFYNLNISNLYIGNKVKKIPGYFAYGLNKLTSISIPNSVTSIGGYAFYGCSMLNSVNIGNSVTSIGNYTFYGCSGLSGLTIPNSVTSIGNSAFYGCNGLSSVFIPNSVTSIGNNAFQNCNGLSQVSISDITAWCGINFGSSTANPLYYAHHLYLNSAEVTDLVVPTTVDNIRNYAFYGCSGLTNLTIPNSVTTIGSSAFYGCSGVTSVSIGYSVTSIGSSAFYGCSGLTNLTIPNSVTSIGNNAFQGCTALQTLIFNAESCNNFNSNSSYHPFYNLNISKINIGNSAVKIPAYFAFGLTKLTNVTIGNSVTSIGNDAFTGCTGLIRVDISDLAKWCRINFRSATTNPLFYAQHLYLNDNEVTDLVVPVDVDAIGDYAFYNCSLTSVKLHQSLASVGKQAFNNSPTIETVTCAATTPPSWNDLAMFTTNVFNHTPLYVPIGSERAYMIDQCWGQFTTIIGKDIQNEIIATSISLNQSQLSLQVGNTSQLIATVLPDSATNTSVTWLSNAPSVASVDENGLVTALAVGNATITATTTDGSNLSASCGVTVTEDLSEYDNYLSLNNLEASRGDTIVIPVTMTNTESIISFQTDIILPEGLELLKEDGEYIIDPSSRMTRTHSIMSNDVSSGAIRVLCYSSNYKPFTGNSGDDLFYITVKVADDAEGDYIIQLKNTLLTNTDFVDLAAPDVAANVNVKAYLLGDANNSGTVTITDVVVTAQYVLELNPQPFVFEAADANVDGNITVADVSRIAWMVLNPAQNAPLRAPALWNNGDSMRGSDISLAAGETRRVSIMLDNEIDYSAFQFDLKLPSGLIASNFQLTDRAGSHAFDVNTLQNDNIRALCYSPDMTAINGHEGALLTFDVTAAGDVNGDILVDGIELVTTACQSVKLDAFTIGINKASRVNELATDKTIAKVEYFNLAGQRIELPSTGVTLIVTTYTDGTRTTSKVFN